MIESEMRQQYTAAEIIRAHREFVASEKKRRLAELNDKHSFNERTAANPTGKCSNCSGAHGGPAMCDHSTYSRTDRRYTFHPNHYPAIVAAHYNPDRSAAAHELVRQAEDRKDPPRGHMCWCVCPRENYARNWPPCDPCRRHRANLKPTQPIEMGRTTHVEPLMPTTKGLDIACSGLAA